MYLQHYKKLLTWDDDDVDGKILPTVIVNLIWFTSGATAHLINIVEFCIKQTILNPTNPMVPLSSTRLVVQKRAAISDVIYDITGIVISILRSSWTIPPIKYWSLLCGKFKDIHFNMECTTLWKDTRSHYICAGVAIALLIRCIDYDNIKLLGH